MSATPCWKTDDGETFDTEAQALAYEEHRMLKGHINQLYSQVNECLIGDFIVNHWGKIKAIMEGVVRPRDASDIRTSTTS